MKATIVIFITFLMLSCQSSLFDIDKLQDLHLTPEVAFPIGYAEYTINDLISKVDSKATFFVEEDGSIVLVYEDSIKGLTFKDHIQFDLQTYTETVSLNLPENIIIPAGDTIIIAEEEYDFQFNVSNEERFDSLIVSKGLITMGGRSNISGKLVLYIEFPDIKKNGIGQTLTLVLDKDGPDPAIAKDSIDLAYTTFNLAGNEQANSSKVRISSLFISNGSFLTSGSEVILDYSIRIDSLNAVFGYLGNQVFQLPSSNIDIELLEIFDRGYIDFELPNLKLDVFSNIGIPLQINMGSFYADLNNTQIKNITGEFFDTDYFLNAPNSGDSLDYSHTEILVNKNNSNFREIFQEIPSKLIFDFILTTNPDDNPLKYNYVYLNSKLGAIYKLQLPLEFAIESLNASDTSEVDFGDIQADEVRNGKIVINIENGFPIGVKSKIQILNPLTGLSFELFDESLMEILPARTDQNGFPIDGTLSKVEINLTKKEIQNLFEADMLLYDITFDTYNSVERRLVKIDKDSYFKAQIGIMLELDLVPDF